MGFPTGAGYSGTISEPQGGIGMNDDSVTGAVDNIDLTSLEKIALPAGISN